MLNPYLPLLSYFHSYRKIIFAKPHVYFMSLENCLGFNPWVGKIRWRRDRLPTPVYLGFPGGSAGKEFTCNVGDMGSVPGLWRSSAEGKGYPLQYSGLENSMDCIVHGVAESQPLSLSLFYTWWVGVQYSVTGYLNTASWYIWQQTLKM